MRFAGGGGSELVPRARHRAGKRGGTGCGALVQVLRCAAHALAGFLLCTTQVIDGLSERGGHPVIRKPMRQWMLRITAYADRLLEDLDGLDWCARTRIC